MAIITATQITQYTNISATAQEITDSGLITTVRDRVNTITNNFFCTDLHLQGSVTFDGSARTIVSGSDFVAAGFADGDEIYIYHSYRNDGYYDVLSVSTVTLTLATSETVVNELSGRSVMISVVRWPSDLIYATAQLVKFDYDVRQNRDAGITSQSLGPWSESYVDSGFGEFGYPNDLLAPLYDHRIVRLM